MQVDGCHCLLTVLNDGLIRLVAFKSTHVVCAQCARDSCLEINSTHHRGQTNILLIDMYSAQPKCCESLTAAIAARTRKLPTLEANKQLLH